MIERIFIKGWRFGMKTVWWRLTYTRPTSHNHRQALRPTGDKNNNIYQKFPNPCYLIELTTGRGTFFNPGKTLLTYGWTERIIWEVFQWLKVLIWISFLWAVLGSFGLLSNDLSSSKVRLKRIHVMLFHLADITLIICLSVCM